METARFFIKSVRTVPAAALAAVPALQMIFLRENNIAFRAVVIISPGIISGRITGQFFLFHRYLQK